MTEVYRICQNCGEQSGLHAAYCSHCGVEVATGTPISEQASLPISTSNALLPIAMGAAGLVIRFGWKLLQSRTFRDFANQAAAQISQGATQIRRSSPEPKQTPSKVIPRAKRTIRIQSSWAVGDQSGIHRQGHSEHIIEIDE
ncbi:MAG: hypothetical protein AAF702_03645 [Chloroflexota bacterium]